MHHEFVGLVIDVKGTEDSINQLYQIITYALPFIAAIIIAAIGLMYKVLQAIKANAKNTNETIRVANGQLSNISRQVQEIQSAQSVSSPAAGAGDIGTGSATN